MIEIGGNRRTPVYATLVESTGASWSAASSHLAPPRRRSAMLRVGHKCCGAGLSDVGAQGGINGTPARRGQGRRGCREAGERSLQVGHKQHGNETNGSCTPYAMSEVQPTGSPGIDPREGHS